MSGGNSDQQQEKQKYVMRWPQHENRSSWYSAEEQWKEGRKANGEWRLRRTWFDDIKRGCNIEFKYHADGIHSGLTPPGNNSRPAGLTQSELSPSVCTPLSPSLFAPNQIIYRASLKSLDGLDIIRQDTGLHVS